MCALQQGLSPPIPEGLSSSGHGFLQGCFEINPGQRATVSQLLETTFISAGGGVLVNEQQDQVTDDEKGILWTEKGELQCDGLTISSICQTLREHRLIHKNEAFVIYSQAAITYQWGLFDKTPNPGQQILFDVGSNPSVEVLQHLASLGVLAHISNSSHLSLVESAGFRLQEAYMDGTANMSLTALQTAITAHTTFKVHSKLDLKHLKEATESNDTLQHVKILLPSNAGRPEGRWYQTSFEALLEATNAHKLFKVIADMFVLI